MSEEKKSYAVGEGHILHDGKLYAPGDVISLTEDEAGKLDVEKLPDDQQDKSALSNKQLVAILEERGVEIPAKAKKADLLDLLSTSEQEPA